MSTATKSRKPRQRRPHARSIAVVAGPTPNGAVLVKLTQDAEKFYYWVTRVKADFGEGFTVEKEENGAAGESYDVNLQDGGETCTCKGHTYGGFCKHADGIRALVKAGKL